MGAASVLSRSVLVLNSGWSPIKVASVQDALGLVAKGSACIIDPETYEVHSLETWNDVSKAKAKFEDGVIRSVRFSLMVPEVIRLTGYEGQGQRSVIFSRRNVFKRDKYTCQYCGMQPGMDELTIDHIVPRSKGGISSWTNCVLACIECNKQKADKALEKCGLKLRKTPRKPSWKALAQVSPDVRRQSWDKFLSDAYWNVSLEE